jgi:uncharacterized membrane protein
LGWRQTTKPTAVLSLESATPWIARTSPHGGTRIDSIDLLRGLVMVVMALDHTRDFFSAGGFNPRDVADPALFLTRWITHFCAPVFVFLAGTSAFLYGARDRTVHEVSRFLFTRGLLLVLLEVTVVRFAWTFSVLPDRIVLQVIWAIGISMVVLAGLVHLPRSAIGTIGIGMMAGHNLLDGIQAAQLGSLGWLWNLLHQPALIHPTSEVAVFALYPLIPWIGVMAAGYALGPVMLLEPARRRRWLVELGGAVTLAFIVLRATNLHLDPAPWTPHDSIGATALSFVNTEKYPPSTLYLAMTLGPALLALAAFDRARGRLVSFFVLFGRVPLFYYIAHLLLLHAMTVAFAAFDHGDVAWLFGAPPVGGQPKGYELGLPGVYLVWMIAVALLYLPCRWYAEVKRRHNIAWLSYL